MGLDKVMIRIPTDFMPPRFISAVRLLPAAGLLLLLTGCGSGRRALIAGQRVTIDSLRTEVARLHVRQDTLQHRLTRLQATLDTTQAHLQQADARMAEAFALRTDSLRHAFVLQFLQGQELTGELRGRTLEVFFFAPGSTALGPEAREQLNRLAARIRRLPAGARVLVEGHTDATPFAGEGKQNNRVLSAERAAYIVRYLTEAAGLDPGRFETAGYGADQPLVPNDTPANRQVNRRVRVAVVEHP